MPDFPILGFLAQGPMSGYDIRRRMAMSTAHFYKASFGSIYPSLERLAAEGLATSARGESGGRLRKAYKISPKGREAFLEWLASPVDLAKGPSALLIRLFFLGSASPAKARKAVGLYRQAAAERLRWLGGVTKDLPLQPDFFQLSTQRFGVEYYGFLDSWLGRLQKELESANPAKAKREAST
jgi:DNA-binding PadR family transcriptional regulator